MDGDKKGDNQMKLTDIRSSKRMQKKILRPI